MPSIKFDKPSLPPLFTPDACTHLWLLDLSNITAQSIEPLQHLLPQEELTRAQAFRRNPIAAIAIRLFVRLCLAPYIGTRPEQLQFDITERGKPFISNSASDITFNLSHTSEMVILAISQHNLIGVDIERAERNSDIHGIAESFYSKQEFTQLTQQSADTQKLFFFKLWTLKEAFLKATGDGIAIGLEKVIFNIDSGRILLTLDATLNYTASDWQFHQTFVYNNHCVAVAKKQQHAIKNQWFNGNNLFKEAQEI